MLLCVDFCVGYCSFRVNYPVGLEKACLRVNRWLSQIVNEKKYCVLHKSAIFEKGHQPILIKITFLESAHNQLSNGICRFFWAFHDLPTNRKLILNKAERSPAQQSVFPFQNAISIRNKKTQCSPALDTPVWNTTSGHIYAGWLNGIHTTFAEKNFSLPHQFFFVFF